MKKRSDFSADVNSWLEFADYDLKTAKWDLKGKIYTSSCYAAQQVAEKSIKALILSNGKVIPKVHSLDRLLSELKKFKINTSLIEKKAQILDKYYISARYPGQYGGPKGLYNKADAKSAISAAKIILQFVRNKI
ncbi:HEPN domain-containing protein [Patescibacteria group bacterium]|nr:HEPN domain-containing protein [Patescibacteria group bacterium]